MRSTTRRPASVLAALAVVAATLLAACNSAASPSPSTAASPAASAGSSAAASQGSAQEPVTIVVGALRPGVTQAAADALFEQIKEFEAKYPWITVKPEEYNWEAPTFTAALAAGTLPDVFTIPFTDGKGLIAQHQITDIDALVRALGYADKFNPSVLVNGQDKDGKIYAVPTAAYGMSLTYNRSLFTKAGLDPDKPPTTWDEVRAAAKTIAEKTGVAGLRLDGDGEHRRLAADDLDLRQRRPDGKGRRRRQGHGDRQQRRHEGGPPAPQGDALAGQQPWAPRSTISGTR